ncbi:MAG: hypothetical protein B6D58_10055, partial [candidate division Zixibacteria bacterium 4484_95]
NGRRKAERQAEKLQAELYQQIGQLKVELDWLKKNRFFTKRRRPKMIIDDQLTTLVYFHLEERASPIFTSLKKTILPAALLSPKRA